MATEKFRGGPFDHQDRMIDGEITEEWIYWTIDPMNPDSEVARYHLEDTEDGKVYVYKDKGKISE
jgi:hypothetical protein